MVWHYMTSLAHQYIRHQVGHLITSHYHRTDVKPLSHNCIHECIQNLCVKRKPVSVMRFTYEPIIHYIINYITLLYQ